MAAHPDSLIPFGGALFCFTIKSQVALQERLSLVEDRYLRTLWCVMAVVLKEFILCGHHKNGVEAALSFSKCRVALAAVSVSVVLVVCAQM